MEHASPSANRISTALRALRVVYADSSADKAVLALKCLQAVMTELAAEGVPADDLKPLADLEMLIGGQEAAAAAPGNPVVSAPVAGTAPADAIKLIWELPYAVRRELPEIKLTMHVFANAPENRFVIINDARHVEGDEIDGMKLVEIRSDGVVFEREGQRFLYPRGGR